MSCGIFSGDVEILSIGNDPTGMSSGPETEQTVPGNNKPAAAGPAGRVSSSSVPGSVVSDPAVSKPSVSDPAPSDPTVSDPGQSVSGNQPTGPANTVQPVSQPAAPLPTGSCTFCAPQNTAPTVSTPGQPSNPSISLPAPAAVTPQAPSTPGNPPVTPQTSPVTSHVPVCGAAGCSTPPQRVTTPGGTPGPALPSPSPAATDGAPPSPPPAGEQHALVAATMSQVQHCLALYSGAELSDISALAGNMCIRWCHEDAEQSLHIWSAHLAHNKMAVCAGMAVLQVNQTALPWCPAGGGPGLIGGSYGGPSDSEPFIARNLSARMRSCSCYEPPSYLFACMHSQLPNVIRSIPGAFTRPSARGADGP